MVYFVTGGAGAPLYSVGSSWFTAYSGSLYHFLKLQVNDCALHVDAINTGGLVFDSYDINKCTGPTPTPPPPTDTPVPTTPPPPTSTSVPTPTFTPSPVLEQNTSGGTKMDVKDGQRGAQSFQHGASGVYYVTKVVLHLSRESDAPDGDLVFNIGTGVNTAALSGSTVNISAAQVTDTSGGSSFMTYEVVYATPVGPLNAGVTYYLNFENSAPNGKAFYVEYAGDNVYSNGTYYKELSDDGKDSWFQILGY